MDQPNAPSILLSVHDAITTEPTSSAARAVSNPSSKLSGSPSRPEDPDSIIHNHLPTAKNSELPASTSSDTFGSNGSIAAAEGDGSSTRDGVLLASAQQEGSNSKEPFHGISMDIPVGGLTADFSASNMQFTNRGSMLIDGKRRKGAQTTGVTGIPKSQTARISSNSSTQPSTKVMSIEEEELSEKVRLMYTLGYEMPRDSSQASLAQRMGLRWQDALDQAGNSSTPTMSRATSTTDVRSQHSVQQVASDGSSSIFAREEHELAGGAEDWQDIDNADVDRYGFIVSRAPAPSSSGDASAPTSPRSQRLQRISTSLQIASESPRRRNTFRSPSNTVNNRTSARAVSEGSATRPESSQSASVSSVRKSSRLRSASNRLPGHSDRRLLATAADMLTLPPTVTTAIENGQILQDNTFARRKEVEREAKWHKMARASSTASGTIFNFDTKDPKLIERTWKGIPDKWRATAWFAFLSASARTRPGSASNDHLIHLFHDYQAQGSPDDTQIDIDVPRTINSHIMFRRRYRGGQRLLFRVLHAMSLHFAETGYVQGMAALTATLLAYYEEEKAFIMLVRLWELRGLDQLYKSGFGGLMQALDDFEKQWLGKGEVATKLADLGITPTAYGTKWYLTLFNYSVPFSAQLRIWDVFMLLGDGPESSIKASNASQSDAFHFGRTLDVLHATSAALIDGMRDILLDSDFENAMKVLTSWVPIQDEDLFMRVAKIEWKLHEKAKG